MVSKERIQKLKRELIYPIRISRELREYLHSKGSKGETYDAVIRRLTKMPGSNPRRSNSPRS